ncbi:MAG: DUF6345 domain-containing protein [Trueperaceae bacterium]|nr:DUF6345 domain-containing protein [Trueperaceae bacterium]
MDRHERLGTGFQGTRRLGVHRQHGHHLLRRSRLRGGFTFEDSSHDDGTLTHTDADGDWGDGDLEWLALYSCQVLRDDWSGLSYFDRWRDEFDGLHMILGFHTNAYVRDNFSREFASNLVDHDMRVRSAWMKASDDTQPTGVAARVVGVYGSGASSINDHFWGHGSVSPDLRGDAIVGRWAIKRVVDLGGDGGQGALGRPLAKRHVDSRGLARPLESTCRR